MAPRATGAHWWPRRPAKVIEVKFLTWTGDNLLRQVVYQGLREDKPAAEVRREEMASGCRRRHNRSSSA